MTNREKQDWLRYKYPLTIITDRYSGTYSGGYYLAFPLDFDEIPFAVNDSDPECAEFWGNYSEPVGKGSSAQAAIDDLIYKMNSNVIIDIPFGAQDSELKGWEYTIPEEMEAIIQDGKVIVRQKKSEEERMMREFNDWLCEEIECRTNDLRDEKDRRTLNMLCYILTKVKDWPEKQKEQKPADDSASTMIPSCWSDEKGEPKYKKEDYFCERCQANAFNAGRESVLKEQKPVEGDNETEIQKVFREGKNAGRKEVFDHPEYYGLQLRRMCDYETGKRNPEWSEEDKQVVDEIIGSLCDFRNLIIESDSHWVSNPKLKDISREIVWLKSLRPQSKEELAKMLQDEYNKGKEDGEREGHTKGYNKGYKDAEEAYNKAVSYHLDIPNNWPSQMPDLPTQTTTIPLSQGCMGIKGDPDPAGVWKPSEEQMEALKYVNEYIFLKDSSKRLELKTLYEDLKKQI